MLCDRTRRTRGPQRETTQEAVQDLLPARLVTTITLSAKQHATRTGSLRIGSRSEHDLP
jgi:hypothetical protein